VREAQLFLKRRPLLRKKIKQQRMNTLLRTSAQTWTTEWTCPYKRTWNLKTNSVV